MTEPELLTASEALQAIRRRELGVAELTGALLERIARIEPQVDAWELIDAEGALAAARQADANFARLASLPLFGVPMGLKDIYFTRGLATTAGFPPWAQHVPDHDAATVERLRQAGAIILGKTVTTQFAFADPPRTRNPWDRERTPGGSSSGSAAAVAARLVPLALGSQTAGSILRPAAYCGVYGLKPTYGLVSRFGIVPLAWTLDHPGPLARSVEDLARALAVLAGPDPRDPATARAQVGDYLAAIRGPGRAPTVGVLEDVVAAADRPVQETFASAIDALVRAGARVKPLRLPTELPILAAAQQTIMQVEAAELHARLHREHAESYGPRMRALIEIGQLVPAQLYVRANRIRQRFRAEVAALLAEVDCLALPTASNLAPTRETTGDRSFQAPWSLIGVPAITLPAGLAEGLPVGLQLVAGPWQEASLLAAAHWAEGVLPPLGLPPTSPGSGRN